MKAHTHIAWYQLLLQFEAISDDFANEIEFIFLKLIPFIRLEQGLL